jgi:drug/metabolite transporter (DMT)-like permease
MRAPTWLLAVLPPFFWAGNVVLGRAFHAEISPFALSFWRWLLALLILLPFAAGALRSQRALVRSHWPILTLLALLAISGYNTFLYVGLQTATATNGVLLTSSIPVLIVGLSFLLLRQGINGSQGLGILLSLVGVLVIVAQGEPARLAHLVLNGGDLWILAAALSWALYSVCLRWRPPGMDPLAFLAVLMVLGLIPLLPLYLWDLAQGHRVALNLVNLSAIGYVAAFPSVLAYVCWNRAVVELGASRTGQFIHLMPVFGSLLAMLLLGEQLAGFHAVGIGLIISGIWFATGRQR